MDQPYSFWLDFLIFRSLCTMYYMVCGVVVVYFLEGAIKEFQGKKPFLITYLLVQILSSKSKSKVPLEPLEPLKPFTPWNPLTFWAPGTPGTPGTLESLEPLETLETLEPLEPQEPQEPLEPLEPQNSLIAPSNIFGARLGKP